MTISNRLGPKAERFRYHGHPMAAKGAVLGLAGLVGAALVPGGPSAYASSPQRLVQAAKSSASCKPGATPVVAWIWVPGINRAVNLFNATHSNICVTLDDVGAGNAEYVKLASAIKAGVGEPDVAEVEYSELPNFEITHSLLNLVPYGANKVKNDFAPWAWQEVSQGSAVYAIPGDSGPVGLYYNSGLFAKYHLPLPKTWAQFASEAATFHKEDPSAAFTNFDATDIGWMLALMAQDGAFPFKYTGGANITIDFNGPKQLAFAAYWQKLINAHLVQTNTDGTVMWGEMAKSLDATWLPAAWGPSYFAPAAGKSLGAWRAAPLPQWSAKADVQTNLGGSSYPVMASSKHPAQAAEFSMWLNATMKSWNVIKTPPSSLFPTYMPLLKSASFKTLTYPVSGSSHPNVVFDTAAEKVSPVEWPPFMTEVITEAGSVFAGTLDGKATLNSTFDAFQKTLVSYAKTEGFKVTT